MTKFNAMKSFLPFPIALMLFILGAATPLTAQHAHLYAGASSQTPGAALIFQNADAWDTNSYGGYAGSPACIYFESNYPELYPGLYQNVTTFSALPATIFTGGPSPDAAALGSYIELRFVSLQGPPGGVLTVWSENEDPTHPSMLVSLPVGATNGAGQYDLSEGDPLDPSADPYGHIHGRRLTLNKPGLYIVGLQLVDTSAHGPGGGPIHRPSAVGYFYLQAGLALSDFSRSDDVTAVRFGLRGFANYALEASTDLSANDWSIVTNIVGTTHSELRWIRDFDRSTPNRFYRLRQAD